VTATIRPVGTTPDPLVPANLDGWLLAVIGVVRRSWPRLVALQLVVLVAALVSVPTLSAVMESLTGASPGIPGLAALDAPTRPPSVPAPGLIVSAVAIALVATMLYVTTLAAGMRVAVLDAAGRTETVTASLRFGLGRMFPLFGWLIVAYLLVFVGFLALVLPGLYVGVVLAATLAGVVVVERESVARCFTLVNRALLPTAGRMVIFWLVLTVYSVLTQVLAWAAGGAMSATSVLVQGVLQLPSALATIAVVAVTYADLRHRENPEVTTRTLADELDRPHSRRGRHVAVALLVVFGLLAVIVPDRLASAPADEAAEPRLAGPAIKVRDRPRSIALSPDGRVGYVVHPGARGQPGTVSVVDLETRAELAAIPVGVDPWDVVVTPDGRGAYVSNWGTSGADGSVSVVDLGTRSVTRTIPLGTGPFGMGLTPDGGKLYVAGSGTSTRAGRQVTVIDTRTNGVSVAIPVAGFPRGVAFTRDGRLAYVPSYGTDDAPGTMVTIIDTATDRALPGIAMDSRPTAVAVTPDGTRIYVTGGGPDSAPGSTVRMINVETYKTAVIPVGVDPIDAEVTPDGRYVYVVNSGIKGANGNTVTVVDTATDRPIATVVVGNGATSVTISPDGRRAYVTNSDSGTISVIDTGVR
jgi:YVTN family beta-propeller protein